jgi:hypothetical protein
MSWTLGVSYPNNETEYYSFDEKPAQRHTQGRYIEYAGAMNPTNKYGKKIGTGEPLPQTVLVVLDNVGAGCRSEEPSDAEV